MKCYSVLVNLIHINSYCGNHNNELHCCDTLSHGHNIKVQHDHESVSVLVFADTYSSTYVASHLVFEVLVNFRIGTALPQWQLCCKIKLYSKTFKS